LQVSCVLNLRQRTLAIAVSPVKGVSGFSDQLSAVSNQPFQT
jgi:hypothetical protein